MHGNEMVGVMDTSSSDSTIHNSRVSENSCDTDCVVCRVSSPINSSTFPSDEYLSFLQRYIGNVLVMSKPSFGIPSRIR